jgi:hypothetical protein
VLNLNPGVPQLLNLPTVAVRLVGTS